MAEGGAAALMLLVFIAAMLLLVLANGTTLYWTKREIQRIDRQQRAQAEPAAEAGATQAGGP